LLYIVYFIHFDPEITTWWSLPMRYAVAAFAFYLIALAWSNWNLRKTFDGINLYLGLVNGALFTFWAILILNQAQELPVQGSSLVVLAVGLSYLLSALIMYLVGKRLQMTVTLYAGGGLLLSLIATSSFFAGSAYEYVLQVFLWVAISVILLALFRRTNYAPLLYISQAIWFFVLLYWFITTWGSNHGEWFGTYIPFLNNGALAWMVLAALGFTYAVMMKVNKHETAGFAHIFAIISHLVVGGLLTVQVENLFADGSVAESITLSVTWGVYALLLFVWGAVRQENLYKIFGSIVLILVAIKTIFFDLWGSDTYYKVIALVILALISFAISYVNNRWKEKADEPEKTEQ
jgi:hypothetical protein